MRTSLADCSRALVIIATALISTAGLAAIAQAGDPEILTIHSLPVSSPGAAEILIAVHSDGAGLVVAVDIPNAPAHNFETDFRLA